MGQYGSAYAITGGFLYHVQKKAYRGVVLIGDVHETVPTSEFADEQWLRR